MKISKDERLEILNTLENMNLKKKSGIRLKIVLWNFAISASLLLKRFIDIILSTFALSVLSPLFGITALMIKIESHGPAFYTSVRIGKNGKPFDFYKFRSMILNADKLKEKLQNENESQDGVIFKMKKDPRVTNIGRFIRRFSIDELPQLYNVFKGDMSLVGPRPPIPSEVAEYDSNERKRLLVKPGITCIWQVSGRSDIPFKEQVSLDKQYIASQNFGNDLMLLLKTIPAVLIGKGAY